MKKSICKFCQKEYKRNPKCKHNFCCRKCYNSFNKEYNINIYKKSPTLCKHCGSPLSYNKRHNIFCNSSCSASYNNRFKSTDCIKKQKDSLHKTLQQKQVLNIPYHYREGSFCKLHEQVCSGCGKTFLTKSEGSNSRKTCSSECLFNVFSRHGKNRASIMLKRSKDEIRLYELCKNHYNNVSHNEIIINGWDADIIIHDHKLAILWNGAWHYKQLKLSNHSLKQVQSRDRIKIKLFTKHGWTVEIFEDRHFTPQSAFEYLISKY